MTSRGARGIRRTTVALVAALAVVLVPVQAQAGPGEPQPGFGGTGSIDIGRGARAFGVDGTGRIVTARVPTELGGTEEPRVELRRFTAAGAPDPTFSGDGTVDLASTGLGLGDPVLLHRPTGTQVARWTRDGLHIWQVDATGSLDPSFGTGGLTVVPTGPSTGFRAIAVEPVGDGLVVAWNQGGTGHLVRLGPGGQPVTGFGGGDGATELASLGEPVVVRPGGGLLVVTAPGLVAVAADGTLGTPVALPSGEYVTGLAVDALDRPLVTVSESGVNGTVLRRLTSALAADPAFGAGGSIPLTGRSDDADGHTWGLQEVGDRRFVLTTEARDPGYGYEGRIRLTALDDDGEPDLSFGTGGTVLISTEFSPTTYADWTGLPRAVVAPAPAGGIVVGAEYQWREYSILINRAEGRLHQLSATGQVVGTYPSAVQATRIQDGGDDGATVLGWGGSDELRRVDLQQPVPPGAPATPVVVSVEGATFRLTWTPASGSPDRYLVSATEPGASTPAVTTEVDASTLNTTITVPATGRPYRFDVRAAIGTVEGPRSGATGFTVAPFTTAGGFVGQLHEDVPTWRPNQSQRAQAAITFGQTGNEDDLLVEVANDPGLRTAVDPVVRIYTAYFGRLPDSGGLRYWVGKRRAGMTVARISAQFAASSEFQRTYGTLSDRAFVTLVYENVLDRAPDRAGLDYWSGRLASKRVNRGQLMANFSESGEHQRKLARRAFAVRSAFAFLGRAAKASEVAPWEGSASTELDLLHAIVQSPEWAQRVG